MEADQKQYCRADCVIVSPNPSSDANDSDFSLHHGPEKNVSTTSRGMRFYLQKSEKLHKDYYGAYVTDLFPDTKEKDFKKATAVFKSIKGENLKFFNQLNNQLEILASDSTLKNKRTINVLFTGGHSDKRYAQIVKNYSEYLKQNKINYLNLSETTIHIQTGYQFSYLNAMAADKLYIMEDSIRTFTTV